jgi:integrase
MLHKVYMIIAPFDRLRDSPVYFSNPELNGSNGLNRAPANPSEPIVDTDIEAASAFLDVHKATPTTRRNYTKEIERLILWAINIKGKPMSSLSYGDIDEYMDFLANPLPYEIWASNKKFPRESNEWRPFVKTKGVAGLAVSSRLVALASLGSFFSWLVDYGYLLKNPMRQIKTKRKEIRMGDPKADDEKIERYLDEDMWDAFISAIEAMPKQTPAEMEQYERAVFLSALMYYLAPRVSELVAGRMGHFVPEGKTWWWKVVGKGSKAAKIPVPDGMIKALIRYRTSLGVSPLPTPADRSPLLSAMRSTTKRSINARQINYILDGLFKNAAAIISARAWDLPQADIVRVAQFKRKAEQLLQASAHWGRHTSITFQIRSGVDKNIVRKNARHGDSRTTDRYIHEDRMKWHKEAQKLK